VRALLIVALLAGPAYAEEGIEPSVDGRALADIAAGVRAGDGGGFVLAQSDLDSVRGLRLSGMSEIPLWHHVRAVLRVEDIGGVGRPGAGLAYVLAPYATAYLLYKAEGFSEPEGEIESSLALRHGPLMGSLTFGQDADAKNRDVEGALAARFEVARGVFTGAMARYRDSLGTTGEALARDSFAGAMATLAVDRVAITAMVGAAGVQRTGSRFETGAAATLAIGTAF
jgi:hypothetical protein